MKRFSVGLAALKVVRSSCGNCDEKFRAFDKHTGKILWEYELPEVGYATPLVYEVGGKQSVVIACGGKSGTRSGNGYIAFALP